MLNVGLPVVNYRVPGLLGRVYLAAIFKTVEAVIVKESKKKNIKNTAMEQLENPNNLVNEIITILANAEDKETLEKSKNILLENQKLQQEQEMSVSSLIEKLTASSEEAKFLNASTVDTNGVVEKINQLQTERSSTDGKIKQIEDDLRNLEDVCKQKEIDEKNLKEKNEEVTNKKVDVLPKTKYYFSLFSNISHIRWDYNSKEEEIKGFVASLNDVKPFCLDVKQNSKYFTVNYLWDLIDA